VVSTATEAIGTRYRLGGAGDGDGFDCSGLIQYAYGEHGIELPRVSADQARAGREVGKEVASLRPGDILTFAISGRRVSHVGLYIGDGRFIHSASGGVRISVLDEDDPDGRYWLRRWIGSRRILE
jgi:cell wall-associated NlpC family hydrolase